MSVTPEQFIECARELAKSLDEISTRNSLSRAYYGAFHAIQSQIPPVTNHDDDMPIGMHKRYIAQLMDAPNNSPERKLGIKLNALFSRRRKADYFLSADFRSIDAALQLSVADEVITLLKTI